MNQSLTNALVGGVLIGIAAVLLLWLNGRIAGNSGIIAQCWPSKGRGYWRLFYLLGLVGGAILYKAIFPGELQLTYNPSLGALIAAGLLVGFGTRLSGGCTSGHGVCGIARLSIRSVIATIIFILTAIITVWIVRQRGGVWW